MENNYVRLVGKVKADAEQVAGRLTFTIEVLDGKGTRLWFDCLCTKSSAAFDKLEGFVSRDEPIEVEGHLVKNAGTETTRVGATRIEVKTTTVMVYVDDVKTED